MSFEACSSAVCGNDRVPQIDLRPNLGGRVFRSDSAIVERNSRHHFARLSGLPSFILSVELVGDFSQSRRSLGVLPCLQLARGTTEFLVPLQTPYK